MPSRKLKIFTEKIFIVVILSITTPLYASELQKNYTPFDFSAEKLKVKFPPAAHIDTSKCPIPETKYSPSLSYPESAFKTGTQGYALLSYKINDHGKAENIQLIATSQQGAFDIEAIKNVQESLFDIRPRAKTCVEYKYKVAYQFSTSGNCSKGIAPQVDTYICTTKFKKKQ